MDPPLIQFLDPWVSNLPGWIDATDIWIRRDDLLTTMVKFFQIFDSVKTDWLSLLFKCPDAFVRSKISDVGQISVDRD